MKMKLKLTISEVQAMHLHLSRIIIRHPMVELQNWWIGYTWISAVKEIHEKTHLIIEEVRVFPVRQDKTYRLTLSRTQAMALATSTLESEPDGNGELPQNQTYEHAVIGTIVQQIMQVYIT